MNNRKEIPMNDLAIDLEKSALVAARANLRCAGIEMHISDDGDEDAKFRIESTLSDVQSTFARISNRNLSHQLFAGPIDGTPPVHVAVLILSSSVATDCFHTGGGPAVREAHAVFSECLEPAAIAEAGYETDFDFVSAMDRLEKIARGIRDDFHADIASDYLPPLD
jgi:hypothetical protein